MSLILRFDVDREAFSSENTRALTLDGARRKTGRVKEQRNFFATHIFSLWLLRLSNRERKSNRSTWKKGGVVKFGAPVISVRRTPRRILQIRRFHRISRYDRRSLHCRHYVTVKHNLGQGRFYVPVPFFSLFYISLFPLLSFVPRFHFLVFFGSGMCCFRFMARSLPGYVCQAGA